CTRTDTCVNGACVGSSPVVCQPTECHAAGTCDRTTGTCGVGAVTPNAPCTSLPNGVCNASGQCTCPASAPNLCTSTCVNLMTDDNNCGVCGFSCTSTGLGCSGGSCAVCKATTPNGTQCTRPGGVLGTCFGGQCVLRMFSTGCSTDADCVPGGCLNTVCLGT